MKDKLRTALHWPDTHAVLYAIDALFDKAFGLGGQRCRTIESGSKLFVR